MKAISHFAILPEVSDFFIADDRLGYVPTAFHILGKAQQTQHLLHIL